MDIIDIDDFEEVPIQEDPVLLSYATSATQRIEIRRSDFARLEPCTFLNDNLIDFALAFYKNQNSENEVHIFSSFFYRKLADYGYEEVQNWSKKVNLFDKRYWIIPIAEQEHWILIVVSYPSHSFTAEEPPSCIIMFDSLDLQMSYLADTVKYFLYREAKKRELICDSFDQFHINSVVPVLPKQMNLWDCGVFIINYARCFLDNPEKFDLIGKLLPDFQELFTEEVIRKGRLELKNIIIQLATSGKYEPGINVYIPRDDIYTKYTRRSRPG